MSHYGIWWANNDERPQLNRNVSRRDRIINLEQDNVNEPIPSISNRLSRSLEQPIQLNRQNDTEAERLRRHRYDNYLAMLAHSSTTIDTINGVNVQDFQPVIQHLNNIVQRNARFDANPNVNPHILRQQDSSSSSSSDDSVLSDNDIENYSVKFTYENFGSVPINCVCCIEDIENGSEARRLPCLHVFHSECIDSWLRNSLSCPICRISVKIKIADVLNQNQTQN